MWFIEALRGLEQIIVIKQIAFENVFTIFYKTFNRDQLTASQHWKQ